MTRKLRHWHRVWILIGWITVPAILVLGWRERLNTRFPSDTTTESNRPPMPKPGADWEKLDVWPNLGLTTLFSSSLPGGPQLWMHWTQPASGLSPDILVYWAPVKSGATDTLPSESALIGVLRDQTAQAVPRLAWNQEGQLWLYSLGHQEVIGRSQAFQFRVKGP